MEKLKQYLRAESLTLEDLRDCADDELQEIADDVPVKVSVLKQYMNNPSQTSPQGQRRHQTQQGHQGGYQEGQGGYQGGHQWGHHGGYQAGHQRHDSQGRVALGGGGDQGIRGGQAGRGGQPGRGGQGGSHIDGMCTVCNQRPVYVDRSGPTPFCSRTCKNGAKGVPQQHGAPSTHHNIGGMCANCGTKPVYIDPKTGPTNSCSRRCKHALANKPLEHKAPPTSSRPRHDGMCSHCCMNKAWIDPNSGTTNYCSKTCMDALANAPRTQPSGSAVSINGMCANCGCTPVYVDQYTGPTLYCSKRCKAALDKPKPQSRVIPVPRDGMCAHCRSNKVYQGSDFCSLRCRGAGIRVPGSSGGGGGGGKKNSTLKRPCWVCKNEERFIDEKKEESPCCSKHCSKSLTKKQTSKIVRCSLKKCKMLENDDSGYCTMAHMVEYFKLLKKENDEYKNNDAVMQKKMADLQKKAAQGSVVPPPYWPNNPKAYDQVNLKPSHAEYKKVVALFRTTVSAYTILSVHLVVNMKQWSVFCGVKRSFEVNLGKSKINEKQVWHGSDAPIIKKISEQGFQRDFNKAYASSKGVYFARDASYSAGGYARPDGSGHKRMFLARLLCGEMVQGKNTYARPPPKPHKPTEEYETMVDNQASPSVYVACQDFQAYPEFILTFK